MNVTGVVTVNVSAEHLATSVGVDRSRNVDVAPSELLLDHGDSLALRDGDRKGEDVDARCVRLTVGDERSSTVAHEAPRATASGCHGERTLELNLGVNLELEDAG